MGRALFGVCTGHRDESEDATLSVPFLGQLYRGMVLCISLGNPMYHKVSTPHMYIVLLPKLVYSFEAVIASRNRYGTTARPLCVLEQRNYFEVHDQGHTASTYGVRVVHLLSSHSRHSTWHSGIEGMPELATS